MFINKINFIINFKIAASVQVNSPKNSTNHIQQNVDVETGVDLVPKLNLKILLPIYKNDQDQMKRIDFPIRIIQKPTPNHAVPSMQPTPQHDIPSILPTLHSATTISCTSITRSPTQNISINGQLQYNKNKIITRNVYEGILSNRKVAVKIDQSSRIDREVEILSTLDHDNILRFLFDCSLSGSEQVLISEFYNRPLSECSRLQIDVKLIMHQLASAIEYLQRRKLLHLNVKSESIFFVKRDLGYVVKLTDFSKAEKISNDFGYCRSFSIDDGFCAPELIRKVFYLSTDIWSLGKVFIYIMLAMGDGKIQNTKTKKGIISSLEINQLKNDSNDMILCKHMLERILVVDGKLRMSAEEILKHPFFWSASTTRDFILNIAKMLEGNNKDFRSELFKGFQKVIGRKNAEWTSRINNDLLAELKKARIAYCNRTGANNEDIDGKKITSLIITIRNMIVHTKTAEVTKIVGDSDEAFIKYWTTRFPNLILHLYETKMRYENKEN